MQAKPWNSLLTALTSVSACLALTACPSDDVGGTTDDTTDTGDTDETEESTDDEVGTTDGTTDESTDDTTESTDDTTDDTTESTDDTTDETTDDTTDDTTDGPDPICGNGVIEDGEECDDGNNLNDDGCLADCVNASCGDGYINEGVEACDDGVNDGSYGGCAMDCNDLGPYCGDAVVNGPEECDDANGDSADGCLDSCEVPGSCLEILDYDDSSMDGTYLIAPDGYDGPAFEVHCDMLTDGGGYTFLKVSPGGQAYAVDAEAECSALGMQLWIPRSLEHKDSGWAIATDDQIGPDASPEYMRILGIYPNQNGATCANQPMNSSNGNCGWSASDDEVWYVHNVNNISEPNGDNTTQGSMYYTWQGGNIQWHNDIGGLGYSSSRYMCDVADKLP